MVTEHFDTIWQGEPWYGSSFKEILNGITAAQAAKRPIADAHSIWEIVLHLAGWEDVVRRRLGGEAMYLPAEGDFPPVENQTEEAWRAAVDHLEQRHQAMLSAIESFPDERLSDQIPGKDYDARTLIQGALEHIVYHSAQIALLKKA